MYVSCEAGFPPYPSFCGPRLSVWYIPFPSSSAALDTYTLPLPLWYLLPLSHLSVPQIDNDAPILNVHLEFKKALIDSMSIKAFSIMNIENPPLWSVVDYS